MIDLKNHFCLQQAEYLREINSPLKLIGIDNFCHTSIDLNSQKRYILTDQPAFTESFYRKGLYQTNHAHCVETPDYFKICLWNDFSHTHFVKNIRDFGIFSGIALIKATKDKLGIYSFSTNKMTDNGFFINIKNQLEDYLQYFHYTANALIQESKKHSFSIEEEPEAKKSEIDVGKLERFQKSIKIDKLMINEGDDYLTHSEILCAYLLLKGKTAKVTADILNISDRTVETHLSNIKMKLNTNNLASLFSILFESQYANEIVLYAERVIKKNPGS